MRADVAAFLLYSSLVFEKGNFLLWSKHATPLGPRILCGEVDRQKSKPVESNGTN